MAERYNARRVAEDQYLRRCTPGNIPHDQKPRPDGKSAMHMSVDDLVALLNAAYEAGIRAGVGCDG